MNVISKLLYEHRLGDPEKTVELTPRYTDTAPATRMGFKMHKTYNYHGFSDIDVVRMDINRVLGATVPAGRSKHPITVVCHVLRQWAYDAEPFDANTLMIDGLVFSIEGAEAVWLA